MTDAAFDEEVDVLVVGSGAAGLTAALTAQSRGLTALVVEKADRIGGSSALSGGGLWVPGAPAQTREGHHPAPADTVRYLETITDGAVSRERLQAYVDEAPRMLEMLEQLDPDLQFVWKPGYPDYFPELPGGSARGSVINIPQIDLRRLGDDEKLLLKPEGFTPKGFWIAPNELVDFYRLRQTLKGKLLFVRLVWRMARARLLGERIVTIGQALVARLLLAFRHRNIGLWLSSPMRSLITEGDRVVGAVVEREGREVRVGARGGVILVSGGFERDPELRREHQPAADAELTLGAVTNTGDGIRAAEQVGAALELMDSAWWYPCVAWGPGKVVFSLNERMMPSQLIVDGQGHRYINEATPYSEFGLAMIGGGTTRIPSWLITDDWSWRRYIIFGHLPIPWIPFAPAPTGSRPPKSWLESGSLVVADSVEKLASGIGVPREELARTIERYNSIAGAGHDDDFGRGDSAYDRYYGDITLPSPVAPLHGGPYYAFRLILADLGTNGGVLTDEHGRALRADGAAIPGLYASGNVAASVMGRSYAGAGATIGPAMTFAYSAANDIAARLAPVEESRQN
jgi:glycine/D-amino acid oxidase-like deaminating enzyme